MSLVERLRRRCNKPDGTKRRPSQRELEAADTIEQLVEALTYTRAALGDPVPIGKRHIARKIDAALSKASETQP
jgi:hypothetical protein